MVDVFVAVGFELLRHLLGLGTVTVQGECYGHGRELLVAMGGGVHGHIFGDLFGVVLAGLVVTSGEDAHLGHHVLHLQLVELHVIVLVVAGLGQQLVDLFPLVQGHHSCSRRQHGTHVHSVFPVQWLGQRKQLLRHFGIGLTFLAADIDVKDVAEALFAGQVLLQLQQVEPVVGHAAHLHGDAVHERYGNADKYHHFKEDVQPFGQV